MSDPDVQDLLARALFGGTEGGAELRPVAPDDPRLAALRALTPAPRDQTWEQAAILGLLDRVQWLEAAIAELREGRG